MYKKIFLLGVVLLITGQMAAQGQFFTLKADGTKASYALTNMQKIVFASNAMTVKMKTGADVTGVVRVSFSQGDTGIENPKAESSIFVFPNPVQSYLTVSGVAKDVKINLLNLNGVLLQSVFAQDDTTDIDVSALPQGVYLLRIGDKAVKFIKQ